MNILKGFLKITYQLTDQFGTFIHFRIAGLPVKVISGFSKGYGYSAENPFTPMTTTDHAWNVVRVDGHWQFVECTWGAGYLDKNNVFQKRLNTFYFFTDPKLFITDHFPWQSNEGSVSNT